MTSWTQALSGSASEPRHVLFHGEPGFGKSVASAQYALRVAATGGLVAAVFFRSGFAPLEDPLGVIARLSSQLVHSVAGFEEERAAARVEVGAVNPLHVTVQGDVTVKGSHLAAGSNLIGVQVAFPTDQPLERAWRCDISDPLRALHEKGQLPPVLIVIDALDETSPSVLSMLADGLTLLPAPVRRLLTSRPGTNLPIGDAATVAQVRHMTIATAQTAATDGEDLQIIAGWVRRRLLEAGATGDGATGDDGWAAQLSQRIAIHADQTFLVAYYVTETLLRNTETGQSPRW